MMSNDRDSKVYKPIEPVRSDHPASDHYVPEPREEEVPSWKYGLPGMLIITLVVAGIPLVAIVILFITFLAKQLSTLF